MNEESILIDVRMRMAELEPAVLESQRLEAALRAIGDPLPLPKPKPKPRRGRKPKGTAVEVLDGFRPPG